MRRSLLAAVFVFAAAGAAAQERQRELIYGAELMTRTERDEYRRKVQSAESDEAAKKVRERHREQIQRRAKARGVTLGENGVLEKKK